MAETVQRVRPRPLPITAYLDNPHRGCSTFQHFNGDELFAGTRWSEEGPVAFPAARANVIDGYLPTTVAYCRWFWALMEPRKGEFDFSMIDKSLETAKERGQTLAVSIMAFGSAQQPQLPDWYIARYKTSSQGNGPGLQPDHDSADYLEHWGKFVREFGRRYDGQIESMDITFVGPWGEGAGEISAAQAERFVKIFTEAFPRTPLMSNVAGPQFAAGLAAGAGWRINCFGDLGNTGSAEVARGVSWNHHYDSYPQVNSAAGERWKTAPVCLETCWVPMHWYNQGWDIDFILEQGLKYHPTYWMPKYTRLPEAWMEKLAVFSNRCGYRYIARQVLFDRKAAAGQLMKFQSWIENVGVAPLHRRYDLSVRFRQGDGTFLTVLDDIDIRKWLPGDIWIDRQIAVPAALKPGWAEMSLGLVAKGTADANIWFANEGSYSDRWLAVGGVEVG